MKNKYSQIWVKILIIKEVTTAANKLLEVRKKMIKYDFKKEVKTGCKNNTKKMEELYKKTLIACGYRMYNKITV
ncbi:hypothetical protein GCM10020331_051150 [Ectobacillus funiculus]